MTPDELKDCREAFEKWARTFWGTAAVLECRRPDEYDDGGVEHAWQAWQAAWSRPAASQKPEPQITAADISPLMSDLIELLVKSKFWNPANRAKAILELIAGKQQERKT